MKEVDALRESLEKINIPRGYFFNTDREQVDALLKGLLTNRERYGYTSCPCRLATGKGTGTSSAPASTENLMWKNSAVATADSMSAAGGMRAQYPIGVCPNGVRQGTDDKSCNKQSVKIQDACVSGS